MRGAVGACSSSGVVAKRCTFGSFSSSIRCHPFATLQHRVSLLQCYSTSSAEGDGRAKEKVVVVGGGVMGVTSAYYLAKTGAYDVTLVDRSPSLSYSASYANGGQNCPSNWMPWFSSKTIPQVFSESWTRLKFRMGTLDAMKEPHPFLLVNPIAMLMDPNTWRFGLRLLWLCNDKEAYRIGLEIASLSYYSHQCLKDLRIEESLDYERGATNGLIHLHRSQASLTSSANLAKRMNKDTGAPFKVLSRKQIEEIEPTLAHTKLPLEGGIYWTDAESGNCFDFVHKLAKRCEAKYGVKFLLNHQAVDCAKQQDNRISGLWVQKLSSHSTASSSPSEKPYCIAADKVVLCGGNHTAELLKKFSGGAVRLPMCPIGGVSYSLSYHEEPRRREMGVPAMNVADVGAKVYYATLDKQWRVAGIAELGGSRTEHGLDVQAKASEGARILRQHIGDWFPHIKQEVMDSGTWHRASRPVTPDAVPVISATPQKGLFVNTGQGHMGWTLSCGSARLLADIVRAHGADGELLPQGVRSAVDCAPFSVRRF
ncbi:D-amino acid dehydrogenase [Balamuthia mandrillaris]